MKKEKTIWACTECGNEYPKWSGKCLACGSWSTLVEQTVSKTSAGIVPGKSKDVVLLKDTEDIEYIRMKTNISELDRVLGNGLIKGSLTLIGGEPGIGKSTIILQMCGTLANEGKKILYVSGEESQEQIALRAKRLGIESDNIYFYGDTCIESIEDKLGKDDYDLCVIDSIQTMYSQELTASCGSVSQVREVTSKIMEFCKGKGITTIIVGHVTKDGNIAGPRVLEHMVDTVLYLEGERYMTFRVLRTVKNRFGSTNEIGIFEMVQEGLKPVDNPSKMLMEDIGKDTIGTVVIAPNEGTRTLLVELQSLCVKTSFGLPRRSASGIDFNKLNLIIAVIEKYTKVPLGTYDVYLNVTGGLKIQEPSIDLGIAVSIISSAKNMIVPKDLVLIGELGLTGELRNVEQIQKRLKEVEKMGMKYAIIPKTSYQRLTKEEKESKMKIYPASNLMQVMQILQKELNSKKATKKEKDILTQGLDEFEDFEADENVSDTIASGEIKRLNAQGIDEIEHVEFDQISDL